MKYKLLIIFTFFTLQSCDFILGTKNWGKGFYFDTDEILYSEKKSYDGIGFTVIPTKIVSLNFDDNFIIAKSIDKKNKNSFWLILKNINSEEIKYHEDDSIFKGYYIYKNVVGPLNQIQFKKALEKYRIPTNLILKKVE